MAGTCRSWRRYCPFTVPKLAKVVGERGSVWVANSTLANNSAMYGGAVYGSVSVQGLNVVFLVNEAQLDGVAVFGPPRLVTVSSQTTVPCMAVGGPCLERQVTPSFQATAPPATCAT